MLERKIWRKRREAPRAAVRLKAAVDAATGSVDVSVLDLSRTGVRLRLKLEDVGLPREAGLFELGRTLTGTFGEVFRIRILHPSEPRTMEKDVRAVRLGPVKRAQGEVDIGARFEAPITEEEARAFGIRLPENEASAPRA